MVRQTIKEICLITCDGTDKIQHLPVPVFLSEKLCYFFYFMSIKINQNQFFKKVKLHRIQKISNAGGGEVMLSFALISYQ